MTPTTLITSISPVYLEAPPAQVGDSAAQAAQSSSGLEILGIPLPVYITALLVLASALGAVLYLIRRARTTDLQQAFNILSRRCLLPNSSRKALLALSESSGIPAAALLVSRGAFTSALVQADELKKNPAFVRSAQRTMKRCFAEVTATPRKQAK